MSFNWLSKLQALTTKPALKCIGLISGTSADSLQAAICEIRPADSSDPLRPKVKLIYCHEEPYPKDLQALVYKAPELSLAQIAELNLKVAEAFVVSTKNALKKSGLKTEEVDLIGSHGQTIYHHSGQNSALKATVQIGDGDYIAEKTGLPVFSDFRARDIAAGGDGAPLTPYADWILFGSTQNNQNKPAVLNLGGIANLTVLTERPEDIIGFDSGPANSALDRVTRLMSAGKMLYDQEGKLARTGKINQKLLKDLLDNDLYLKRPPPKSSGFEVYGDTFVQEVANKHGGVDLDLLTTLTEFTAASIADALKKHILNEHKITQLIAAGGGTQNLYLIERLQALISPIQVKLSDEFGVPYNAREAISFALFAYLALIGQAVSYPKITGVVGPRVLGKLALA